VFRFYEHVTVYRQAPQHREVDVRCGCFKMSKTPHLCSIRSPAM